VLLFALQERLLSDPLHGHLPSAILVDELLPVPPASSVDASWLDGAAGMAWWLRYRFRREKPLHALTEHLEESDLTAFVRSES
jgi:hypothetical protein